MTWHEVRTFLISQMTGTSGRQRVPRDALGALTVPIPPLPEQRAIAHVLGAIDDKIDLNRRMAATLEEMARALFTSWFVRFDPVRAKMAGLPTGLPAYIEALFPDALVDSELGEVPEGWGVGDVSLYASLNTESWGAANPPASVEYVDLSSVKDGVLTETSRFTWSDAPSRARRIARVGDTIVGTVRPGNRSYWHVQVDGLTVSTGFAVLRPLASYLAPFVYIALTLTSAIARLELLADGGAYPAVNPAVVHQTPVVGPPEAILRAFGAATEPGLKRIGELAADITTHTALRDTLLPKLVSGEVRITDPEAFLRRAGLDTAA